MAENSAIEWTDHTFNPWMGCTKVGPGCDSCYAEALMDTRYGKVRWGTGQPRVRTSAANWRKPLQWNAQPFVKCMGCGWRGEVRTARLVENPPGFHPPAPSARLCPVCDEPQLKEARARVFCASLADVFDNEVSEQWRLELFHLIGDTPNLDWLLLTKRIGNAAKMSIVSVSFHEREREWPWPNVWLGATVVNQEEADRDIPKLLATPARVRFLSCEPLLGPINLHRMIVDEQGRRLIGARPGIDWSIVGGESGPKARPLDVEWVRSIVQQCKAAGVPVLVKQLGRTVLDHGMSSPGQHWPPDKVREQIVRHRSEDPAFAIHLKHPKGGDWDEWPEDLRVREFPGSHT